jgi:hypothetical protein
MLNEEKVRLIKRELEEDPSPTRVRTLANLFEVPEGAIQQIQLGLTWVNVEPAPKLERLPAPKYRYKAVIILELPRVWTTPEGANNYGRKVINAVLKFFGRGLPNRIEILDTAPEEQGE